MEIVYGILLGIIALIFGYVSLKIKEIVPYIEKKFDIDISKELESGIEDTLSNAIDYAEEYSAKKIKENDNIEKVASNEKLNSAVDYVEDIIGKEFSRERIAKMIESKLGRTDGYGASETIKEK